MEEQLISYETAVLTKQRGFVIDPNEKVYVDKKLNNYVAHWHAYAKEIISAPTQGLLQKWLREIHKIDVLPILRSSGKYSYDIYHYDTPNQIGERTRYTCMNSFSNYEECLELGLQEALKLIKI